jgi:hypothetical protein
MWMMPADRPGTRVASTSHARDGDHDAPRRPVRDILAQLVADQADDGSAEQRLLIVVRHGDAGDQSRWDGPDLRRPLAAPERRQAEGLVFRLADYPVERILCSPTLRCRYLAPLALDLVQAP